MTTAISLRLPQKLNDELNEIARTTDRPRTYLIREAIETYISEYAEYRVALDRLLDKDDEIIESAELRRRLGL